MRYGGGRMERRRHRRLSLAREMYIRCVDSRKDRAISSYCKELRRISQPRGIGCDCLRGYVPSGQMGIITRINCSGTNS